MANLEFLGFAHLIKTDFDTLGSRLSARDLNPQLKYDSFTLEQTLKFGCHVLIFLIGNLGTRMKDGDFAARAGVKLCHLETDVAAADHCQMRWQH